MQDACVASEHAGRKSTRYEWINASTIQPAAVRKRALATDWKALCRASARAHVKGVARARR
eukprot:1910276-Pleurochrysis_carterae.AAC.1